MPSIVLSVLIVHFLLLLVLCLFGLHRLSMVVRWFAYKNKKPIIRKRFDSLPMITVQIPLYNERLVAGRIVDACAAFDYPCDRLQIQIVDDSTDATSDLVAARVRYHQNLGIDIQHIKRVHRRGFKAGALKEASKLATGEFVAIFDADFLPSPSLLRTTIDHFTDEKVGMVQFRWEHLNRGSSRFTEAQSIMLDAHFALEQQVRCASDMLLNFNGTAGMWRAKTIIEAGDWSADTLTEDLDLSYRAQMCGWKMVFLSDIECPGEIPADMNAFKSQQHRWAKGGIQVMKKLLLRVWKSPYSVGKKIESSFHLMNNLAYFIVLFDTLFFLIPSLWVREKYQVEQIFWLDVPLLILATGGHLIYLFFGQVALGRSKWAATKHLPWLMLMGIQLAFNNARAGLEALIGQKSEFVRTPKTGEMHIEKSKQSRVYQTFYSAVLPKSALIELLVSLVYFAVLLWSIEHQKWAMLPFLLLLVLGFASAALANVWQHITVRKSSC